MAFSRSIPGYDGYEAWIVPDIYSKAVVLGEDLIVAAGDATYYVVDTNTPSEESNLGTIVDRLDFGRCLMTFRVQDCEIVEVGWPVQLPEVDEDHPLPRHYDTNTGICKLDDSRVLVVAATDGNPTLLDGDTFDDDFLGARGGVAWAAQLTDATNLAWEVGDRVEFDGHFYYDRFDLFYNCAGVMGDNFDSTMGVTAMSPSLAVVSYAYIERALWDSHLDPDGDGDFTDQDLDVLTNDPENLLTPDYIDPDSAAFAHQRLCPLHVDGVTITPGTPVRVSDRQYGNDFGAGNDQPYRMSATKGVLGWSGEAYHGWVTVWTHGVDGEIDNYVSTKWNHNYRWYAEATQEQLNAWPNPVGAWGSFFPTHVLMGDLLLHCGNEGVLRFQYLSTLRITGMTPTLLAQTHVFDSDFFPFLQVLDETTGEIFGGAYNPDFNSNLFPRTEPEGQVRSTNGTDAFYMWTAKIDLVTGQMTEYIPHGLSSRGYEVKVYNPDVGTVPSYEMTKAGRAFGRSDDRCFPWPGKRKVVIFGPVCVGVLDPTCQPNHVHFDRYGPDEDYATAFWYYPKQWARSTFLTRASSDPGSFQTGMSSSFVEVQVPNVEVDTTGGAVAAVPGYNGRFVISQPGLYLLALHIELLKRTDTFTPNDISPAWLQLSSADGSISFPAASLRQNFQSVDNLGIDHAMPADILTTLRLTEADVPFYVAAVSDIGQASVGVTGTFTGPGYKSETDQGTHVEIVRLDEEASIEEAVEVAATEMRITRYKR
jgi:hypothetical protein